jgi:hypothetical protein
LSQCLPCTNATKTPLIAAWAQGEILKFRIQNEEFRMKKPLGYLYLTPPATHFFYSSQSSLFILTQNAIFVRLRRSARMTKWTLWSVERLFLFPFSLFN